MSKDTLYSLTQTSGIYNTTTITDELYTDVGSGIFQLGTVKRLFLGGTDVIINTAAGGAGTTLIEGTDYDIVEEDFDYTTEIGYHVYTGIQITTVGYQSGDLYITYKTYGSYTDPNSISVPVRYPTTAYKSTSYAITDTDNYYRIEATSTGGDITITLPVRSNNQGRRIEIANIATSTYKVIVTSTTANQLTNDLLTEVWLPKCGNFITLQESANSSCWEIINCAITSQLRLSGYSGYSTTATKIPKFTNIDEISGNLFLENHSTNYAAGATGLEITAQLSGKYGFTYSVYNGVADFFGLSINSTQLTTPITNILQIRTLGVTLSGTSGTGSFATTINLNKNDIIRPHHTNATAGSTENFFIVSYLGN